MARVPIANLKGPQGETGPQGLPGMNAAPTDEAVAGLIGTAGTSESKTATQSVVQARQELTEFNVLDYGAVPDPLVNNTPAISAAIAAAEGKGAVVIPPGEYGLQYAIVLKPGTVLRGYGATLHRIGTGGLCYNWEPGDTTTPGYDGHGGILVEGVTFDAHGDTITGMANIMTFNHCRDVTVRDCRFLRTSGAHALEFNAVDGALADNCQFLGYAANGQSFKEAIQVDSANPGDSGLPDGTMAKNITIRSCTFDGYGALPAHDIAVGSHIRTAGAYYDNIRVQGCEIRSPKTYGIRGYYWRKSIITGCSVLSIAGTHGIRLEGAVQSQVIGCTIIGPGAFGINLTAACLSCQATGNTVEGAAQGIYDGYSSVGGVGNQISNNTIRRTSSYGIIVDGATDTLVSGNLVDGAGYPSGANGAIRCAGGALRPSIAGNKVLPHRAGTEVAAAVSIQGELDAWVFGNDFKGIAAALSGPANTTGNRT